MMKKLVLMITALMTSMVVGAQITISVEFNGDKATVNIPEEATPYVSCSTGESSHVSLVQAETVGADTSGEIIYSLSGTTEDGGFTLEGKYKATIEVNNLTLTNPSGPAINIQDGKRIKIEVKKGTTNSLADGKNSDYNGCIHCEGHLEFKKTGTLNIVGNNKHAVYSKEYLQIAKPTINITGAKKDGFHCKQYFWMEDAATVTISGVKDDGIQVEVDDKSDYTGPLPDHEDVDANGDDIDENSGNVYLDAGTLTIGECGGSVIKADGQVIINGGTQDYDTNAVSENNNPITGISTLRNNTTTGEAVYDLNGRQLKSQKKGITIIKNGNNTKKVIIK